ncbi:hypothetical protein AKJ65_02580 [candidate division MSBL1 archaeon SCGC-AAA259E19]|uniref:Uncharacterized protein n=1 Tax=candidate division MSBL1 archaeon SCGC-AAA259E19 TaxID=1698264 RepID=A0A133ULN0_9EURY|nr:hypothetical protein AKJ65_02580 [candidate division MSBL1 archaeon SCGC-AAA259E19]
MGESEDQKRRKQEIIGKYHNKKMKEALEPLFQKFQKWKDGEVSHYELSDSIHECHKEMQRIYSIFNSSREFLMKLVEADDDMPFDRNGNRTD